MDGLQRVGGVAALIEAAIFVFALVVFLAVLVPAGYGSSQGDPGLAVAYAVEHKAWLHAWNLLIYVVFGGLLVLLASALHERLKSTAPALAQLATAFGLIWAGLVIASGMVANIGLASAAALLATNPPQAASLWLAMRTVETGLGGGNEIVGGLWVLLASSAGLRGRVLPRALNWLGVAIGAAGLLTLLPGLQDVGAVFGLGCIVWFAWLGERMLRG